MNFGNQVAQADAANRLNLAAELKQIVLDPARRTPDDVARCARIQAALGLPGDFTGRLVALVEARDAVKRRMGTDDEQAAAKAAIMAREPEALRQLEAVFMKLRHNNNSSNFLDQILKFAALGGRCDLQAEAAAIGSPVDELHAEEKKLRDERRELMEAEDRLQMGLRAILPAPEEPSAPPSARVIERTLVGPIDPAVMTPAERLAFPEMIAK